MSEVAQRVKSIIVDKLGVEESELLKQLVLPMIWEPTHWTQLN